MTSIGRHGDLLKKIQDVRIRMQRGSACQAKLAQKRKDESIVIEAVGLNGFMSNLRFDRLCAPISNQTAGVPVNRYPYGDS